MRYFAGLDVSLHKTSICVMDFEGHITSESELETDPNIISKYLKAERKRYVRIGIESQSMVDWIYGGLAKAGLPIICIEALHASRLLKAKSNKTDRNDARGIADMMRVGLYKAVHIKTPESRSIRTALTVRTLLLTKSIDIENAIKGLLRLEGQKFGRCKTSDFEDQARRLAKFSGSVEVVEPLLAARSTIRAQYERVHAELVARAGNDPICRRLMTAPGVGPIVSLNYRSAIDLPERFIKSRTVGAHLGLTPVTWQSGATDRRGRISRSGDHDARRALFNAAVTIMNPHTGPSDLKAWGARVVAARGKKKGLIAVARRLAVILHRMWIDGTDFERFAPEV